MIHGTTTKDGTCKHRFLRNRQVNQSSFYVRYFMYIYSICYYHFYIPLLQADTELEISPGYCGQQLGVGP